MSEDNTPEANALLIEQIAQITTAIIHDDSIACLVTTNILIKTLPEEFIKINKIDKLRKKIKELLMNPNINRYLRLSQRIKEELSTSIEYYDKDIGSDERLFYQEDLENKMLKIYEEISEFIATMIKTQLTDKVELN